MYLSALQLPVSALSKALDCKDSANERNVSSLTNCRVQPILCKDSASEWNNKTKHAVFVFIPERSLSLFCLWLLHIACQ